MNNISKSEVKYFSEKNGYYTVGYVLNNCSWSTPYLYSVGL